MTTLRWKPKIHNIADSDHHVLYGRRVRDDHGPRADLDIAEAYVRAAMTALRDAFAAATH